MEIQSTNHKCTMDNRMITAIEELSLLERRLLFLFISKIRNSYEKKDGKLINKAELLDASIEYCVSARDFAEVYNMDYESAKDELMIAAKKLYAQDVSIQDEKGLIQTRYISSIKYDKTTHELKYYWAQAIIPYIHQLSAHFTSVPLQYLRTLASNYSLRLVTIAVMELNKNKGKPTKVRFMLDEIRENFKLNGKYAQAGHFLERVLLGPMEAANEDEFCGVRFTYAGSNKKVNYIKDGKKVIGIICLVEYKYKKEKDNIEGCSSVKFEEFAPFVVIDRK